MEKHLKAAKDAALKAGKMLADNMKAAREITFKGAVDLVTDFDKKAERMIFESLSSVFPNHAFLAEEGLLKEEKGAKVRWIVDPLDGTTNYAHRFPIFCVSIALEKEGELSLGVVYDPMRGEMFSAMRGKGAYLNGEKIKVSSVRELDKSLLATGFPYDIRESNVNNIDHFSHFAVRAQAVRRCGSAALDLCYVACGRFDGFWELKLNPWDVAAGALMVEEAGGQVSDFQNGEFSIYGAEVLASNGLVHEEMADVLQLRS